MRGANVTYHVWPIEDERRESPQNGGIKIKVRAPKFLEQPPCERAGWFKELGLSFGTRRVKACSDKSRLDARIERVDDATCSAHG